MISSLGKPSVTSLQAKKLDSLGMSFSVLVNLHITAKSEDKFQQILKAKGVNSKPLREKLVKLLHSRTKTSR